MKISCYWCGAEMNEFDSGCSCLKEYHVTQDELAAGICLGDSDFCDHFCCGLPEQICRARQLMLSLAGKFEMKLK